MAYTDNFPATRPVFMADFANGGKIDPRATFSRSDTPPTYAAPSAVHYWSNEKHLSSENILLQSQTLDTTWASYGLHSGTPLTGSITAPDGTSTAWQLNANTGVTDAPLVYQQPTLKASTAYTASVHVKSGTASHAYISIRGAASHYAFAQIEFASPSSVSTGGAGFTGISGTVTALGSSWYRISVTCTTSSSVSSPFLHVGLSDGSAFTTSGYPTFTTGAETLLVWGVQLNTTGATDYNATTTSIHREYAPTLKSVATAGQPRFEYDPSADGQSAGTSLGILIEGQSTNLLTHSSEFSNGAAYNTFRATVVADVAVAPDGTLTADALTVDATAAANHGLDFSYNPGGATAQTISVYAKAGTKSWLAFRFTQAGGTFNSSYAYYNLSTATTGFVSSGVTASAVDCGNGWVRCVATATANASGNNGQVNFYIGNGDQDLTFDGNSYDYVLLWGGQAEANASHASSLISTSGAAATRAAESLSVTDSSLFDNGGGTLYAEASHNVLDEYNGVFAVSDGTGANTIEILNDTSRFRGQVVNANSTNAIFMDGTITAGQFNKHALTFSSSEASYYVNGSQIGTTDSSVVVPAVSEIDIGDVAWGRPLNGHIRKVALYSEPISETAAAALTS